MGLYTVKDFNIYGYDIFCINEFPRPSLPPHTFFNPMTRPQSRLVLNVPVLHGTALLLPGLA